eukprot:UN23400
MIDGSTSSCTSNNGPSHSALCYCGEAREPTVVPTSSPTTTPTHGPTTTPTIPPTTTIPTKFPSHSHPTHGPTTTPTMSPTTSAPTRFPSHSHPTFHPSDIPSNTPTGIPTQTTTHYVQDNSNIRYFILGAIC